LGSYSTRLHGCLHIRFPLFSHPWFLSISPWILLRNDGISGYSASATRPLNAMDAGKKPVERES
jgi:hypothetical protein